MPQFTCTLSDSRADSFVFTISTSVSATYYAYPRLNVLFFTNDQFQDAGNWIAARSGDTICYKLEIPVFEESFTVAGLGYRSKEETIDCSQSSRVLLINDAARGYMHFKMEFFPETGGGDSFKVTSGKGFQYSGYL